ncbi:MAG: efflux RND transporter periplasmic adaptor subunit [Phycisphaerae bacterium]|nr:efflux RND transporter periplasmic adaptor subunit [Phycisphaerae bacterium]
MPKTDSPAEASTRRRRCISCIVRGVLLVGILAAAVGVAAFWLANRPQPERGRPEPRGTRVEVRTVRAHDEPVTVEARGTVIPVRQVRIAARVAGEVTSVNEAFEPGGRFAAGQMLLQIDREDYAIAVEKATIALERAKLTARQRAGDIAARQADLARAREALKIEQGAAAVAQREYDLLGEQIGEIDRDLVLRKWQLASAEATVTAAEAAVESAKAAKASAEQAVQDARVALRDAELDLARTTVTAPFDGAIVDVSVKTGSQVASHEPLATFVGTDAYWVRLSVPVGDLRWIDIPGFNSDRAASAAIHHAAAWGEGIARRATTERLMTELEPAGRMAQLLVRVADPLGLDRPADQRHAMILGAYVRAEITGRRAPDCVRVPRRALREDQTVWVLAPNDTLVVRSVEVLWSTDEAVYVRRGLDAGERLVVSDIAAPVEGMALRAVAASDAATRPTAPADGDAAATREATSR